MKHTKNMTYENTTESRELFLYTTNNAELYKKMIASIIDSMKKKAEKGVYDKDKAVDAFYRVATEGSNRYYKDYGYRFSVGDRWTAAVDMEKYYREEIFFDI